MYLAYRFRPLFRPPSPEQSGLDRYREVVTPIRMWLMIGVAVLLGLFAGTSASGQWRQYMLWRNGVPFGDEDAYFDRDIGFYVFDLPWFHYLVDSAMAFAVVALLMAALVHYLYGGIQLQTAADRLSGAAQVQLSVLLGVFVLAKAADYWLDRFDLVNDKGALITGMTYTGENAVLPAKNILMGIALICAVLFFLNVWRRTWMLPSVGLALLALSAVLLGMIWPADRPAVPGQPERARPGGAVHRGATSRRPGRRTTWRTSRSSRSRARARPTSASSTQLAAETSSVPLVDPQVVNRDLRAGAAGARLLLRGRRARRRPLRDRRQRPGAGARRPRARPGRHLRGRPELVQPPHRLHPRQRHDRRLRQPARRRRHRARRSDLQWAEGQQAGEDALTQPRSPTATRTGSTSASRAPTTPWSARPARTPPTSSSTSAARPSDDEGQTTTYDGDGRRAGRQRCSRS